MNLDLMVLILEIIFLKKLKDGAYVSNVDEYADIRTHWIALYVSKMVLLILIILELNTFLKRLENALAIKTCKTKIFRIQANNSIMYGYLSIGFIDFMLIGKNMIEYTSLFLLYNFKKMTIQFWSILKLNDLSNQNTI